MAKDDFHAVKQFLIMSFGSGIIPQRSSRSLPVDVNALSTGIVDLCGEYVGTTAKPSEREDPLAFVTLLPCKIRGRLSGDTEDVQRSLDALMDHLGETIRAAGNLSKKQRSEILASLQDPSKLEEVALVLHERYMNLPAEMAAPLYQQLLDDLPAAKDESAVFSPKQILMITPIYREVSSHLDAQTAHDDDPDHRDDYGSKDIQAGKQPASKRTKAIAKDHQPEASHPNDPSDYQYYYGEAEMLEHRAEMWWDFSTTSPHETTDSRRAFGERGIDAARRAFLLSFDAFCAFVKDCQTLLSS